ncbi:MAG: SnoaL-like polyketide cyclase [Rhizobacter sp.]|nr:SnoaL-like polyketide cyclase [Rhizobacter sp.]
MSKLILSSVLSAAIGRHPFKKVFLIAAGAVALGAAFSVSAQSLTEAQARAAIAPWYAMFNQPFAGDVAAQHELVVASDYKTCWGPEDVPGGCWGKEQSIKTIANFAKTVPDMRFEIKEVLVAGNRVIVRGEVSGTPSGDFFGVPYGGKSFRIAAVDIQTVENGKIARTWHLENWILGLGQLRAK